MNPTSIHGSVNDKGLFTAKNPYPKPTGFTGGTPITQWHEFENSHPQLLTYTPSNVLVTNEEHVEVVEVWRYFDFDMNTWVNVNVVPSVGYKRFSEIYRKTDRVYITITPTELTDAKPFKSVDEPDAQPLEGVKTSEEILNKHLVDWRAIEDADFSQIHDAMQEYAEAYHAQFATDAGEGKPNLKKMKKDFEKFLAHPWKDLYQDIMLLSAMREAAEWGFDYANKNQPPSTH